ncbi:hypothetical protein ACIOWI_21830 [Streptomyces sp. NPDC087659]|uniref:hypothetical protein n=1 Tax=Streptomyces sp. NPDC087659 TaxID=3365801 RepID=UPI00382AF57F
MAAEKLAQAADALGVEMKVETQGSIGAENVLLTTMSDIRTGSSSSPTFRGTDRRDTYGVVRWRTSGRTRTVAERKPEPRLHRRPRPGRGSAPGRGPGRAPRCCPAVSPPAR